MNQSRWSRLFPFVFLALTLSGCVTTVESDVTDDVEKNEYSAALTRTDEGCEAPSLTSDAYELAPALGEAELSIDATQADLSGSTCRRVCACCSRNGNRFCCSHCRFCSGPIGVTDVFAQ